MNIYEAITSIMSEGYAIAKNKRNTQQGFQFDLQATQIEEGGFRRRIDQQVKVAVVLVRPPQYRAEHSGIADVETQRRLEDGPAVQLEGMGRFHRVSSCLSGSECFSPMEQRIFLSCLFGS